jgi:hypothetical protein
MTLHVFTLSRAFTWLDLAAMGFAVLYLAHVVTTLAGPWDLFLRWREQKVLGGLTTCIWCTAPYVATLTFCAYWFVPGLVWPFAIAGLALCLRTYTGVMHG